MCRTEKFRFPNRDVPRNNFVKSFQTADIVKAVVNTGEKVGTHVGFMVVKLTKLFNIYALKLVQNFSHKYCKIIHKKDGYGYEL